MKLCDSVNPVEVYDGRNVSAMPKLLAEGRVPMNVSQLMNYRMNDGERFSDWLRYFDTSDLIAYGSKRDGKVKFILTVEKNGRIRPNGRRALELINPLAKLNYGAVELGDEYSSLEGIEVAVGNLGRRGKHLTQDEILGNKVWRILARHPDEVPSEFAEDPNLLREYSTWIANQTRADKNMTVYIDSLSKSPKLRAWCVEGFVSRFGADGEYYLTRNGGRLVGLAQEAHASRIARPTLKQVEQALGIVNRDLTKGGFRIEKTK